jgi:hypothetical protein
MGGGDLTESTTPVASVLKAPLPHLLENSCYFAERFFLAAPRMSATTNKKKKNEFTTLNNRGQVQTNEMHFV